MVGAARAAPPPRNRGDRTAELARAKEIRLERKRQFEDLLRENGELGERVKQAVSKLQRTQEELEHTKTELAWERKTRISYEGELWEARAQMKEYRRGWRAKLSDPF